MTRKYRNVTLETISNRFTTFLNVSMFFSNFLFIVNEAHRDLVKKKTESTDEIDGLAHSKIIDTFHQTTPYSLLVQSLIKQVGKI